MGQTVTLTGMVLLVAPIGDYDKRLVLLTKERGKITAFAKGSRRQNSPLLAAASPFSFGAFTCFEGRTSYNLMQAEISNYFSGLSQDYEAAYYGFYFMEIADYYARENNDEAEMLRLLYATLRALMNAHIPNELIRYIFEWKSMVISGEYPQMFCCTGCGVQEDLRAFVPAGDGLVCKNCLSGSKGAVLLLESTIYTYQYIASSTIEKLYSFTVSEDVLREMKRLQSRLCKIYMDKQFKSLDILESIVT